jgi:hypothetical protein
MLLKVIHVGAFVVFFMFEITFMYFMLISLDELTNEVSRVSFVAEP